MDVIVHDDLFAMMNDACVLRAEPTVGTALKVRLYNIQSQLNKEPTDAFDENKETEELEIDQTRRRRLPYTSMLIPGLLRPESLTPFNVSVRSFVRACVRAFVRHTTGFRF